MHDKIIIAAALVFLIMAVMAFIGPAHCKRDGGFWAEGECHYGLESGGSVGKVRK